MDEPLEHFDVTVATDTDGLPRVAVFGEIDCATAPRLRAVLEELIARRSGLEVDLAGVSFIDSSGLAVLIDINERSELLLRGVSAATMRLFTVSGIDGVLRIEG